MSARYAGAPLAVPELRGIRAAEPLTCGVARPSARCPKMFAPAVLPPGLVSSFLWAHRQDGGETWPRTIEVKDSKRCGAAVTGGAAAGAITGAEFGGWLGAAGRWTGGCRRLRGRRGWAALATGRVEPGVTEDLGDVDARAEQVGREGVPRMWPDRARAPVSSKMSASVERRNPGSA